MHCVALLPLILPLTGCWDMVEINTRAFVIGLGVDESEAEGQQDFTFVYTVVTEEDVYTTVTVSAPSLPQAINAFNKNIGADANFEHLLCVALGADTAKSDFYPLLGCLFSWPAVRRQSLVIASDGRAEELLAQKMTGGSTPSVIASAVETTDRSRTHRATATLHHIFIAHCNNSGFFLYEIGLEETGKETAVPAVSGALSYDAGGYKGQLEKEEAKWLRLFFGRQTDGVIGIKDRDGRDIYFRVTGSNCVKSMSFTGDKLRGEIHLRLECALFDGGDKTPGELADYEDFYSESQRKIAESMSGILRKIVTKCMSELGAAPTGLDDVTRRMCGDWFEEHAQDMSYYFAGSDIDLRVTCNLRRTGHS